MKIIMMVIVMSGVLSGCSSSPQGSGSYLDEQRGHSSFPSLYPYPYPQGNSNTYIEMQDDTEVSIDNHSAFQYPYGNSGTHLNY